MQLNQEPEPSSRERLNDLISEITEDASKIDQMPIMVQLTARDAGPGAVVLMDCNEVDAKRITMSLYAIASCAVLTLMGGTGDSADEIVERICREATKAKNVTGDGIPTFKISDDD